MRPGRMSTRSRDDERLRRATQEPNDPDDDEQKPHDRQELAGEEEQVVEAELRARYRPLLFGFGHLGEEYGGVARADGGRLGEHCLVLCELRTTHHDVAEPDAQEQK